MKVKWYVILARFAAGLFLSNSVPHFVAGVMGHPFPTPFASPPGFGDSSAVTNVFWGAFNFAVGYLLVFGFGEFRLGLNLQVLALGVGGLLLSIQLAWHFGEVYHKKMEKSALYAPSGLRTPVPTLRVAGHASIN